MIVLTNAIEEFVLTSIPITALPDYILRLNNLTAICIDQSSLKQGHRALIESVCEHDAFGVDYENMYVIIPDNHKPFICMFPSELINDEDLQSDIEKIATHDNYTEYCRISY